MKSIIVFVLVVCASMSMEVNAQCLTDQLWTDSYIYTDQYVTQSFETCTSGNVERFDFFIHNFEQGDLAIEMSIFEGDGTTGPMIFSDQFTVGDGWGTLNSYFFDTDLWLSEDVVYTMKFDFQDQYGACWVSLSDVYDEGVFSYDVDVMVEMDLGFRVHMPAPPATPCSVWKGIVNDQWDDPQNWTPELVPDSNFCAVIPVLTSGVYPDINEKANVRSLTIEEGAMITVQDQARLSVYDDLMVYGESDFTGDVVMINSANDASIQGGVTFNRLIVYGLLFCMEPIVIKDLLDLSNGQVINFGTEITVLESEEHKGHVYAPGNNFSGQVTLKKKFDHDGAQLYAAPVSDNTIGQLQDSTNAEQLLEFNEGTQLSNFHDHWEEGADQNAQHSPIDAYRLESDEGEYVSATGQISTENQVVAGSSSSGNQHGDWKFVANPYPSILDWNSVGEAAEGTKALYKWNEEEQQFSAYVTGIGTHDASTRIRPMEGFFIRVPVGEEVEINYDRDVVRPVDLYNAPVDDVVFEPLLKLRVESSTGVDNTVVSLHPDSDASTESNRDAFKVPSMNKEMPTLGSISSEGYVLSINRLNLDENNGVVPLYFTPGSEGQIVFDAQLIENFNGQDEIYLEDRKEGHFHNLFSAGSYTTYFAQQDVATRFFLHLNWSPQGHEQVPQSELTDEPDNKPLIYSFEDQVHVIPPDEELFLAKTSIQIYSMNGSLIYADVLSIPKEKLVINTHVNPGYYLVRINDGKTETVEKVMLE